MRPEKLPGEHLAHFRAGYAEVVAAQKAFALIQATIAAELNLPDGIRIRLDGTILWPDNPTPLALND